MDTFGERLRSGRPVRTGGRPDSHRAALIVVLLAALLAPQVAAAADVPIPITREALAGVARRSAGDVRDLAGAPLRWRAPEWRRFGEGVALVAAVYAVDRQLIDAVQRNRHGATDHYLHNVTKLGGGLGENLTIAMAVGGYLSGDERLMNTGIDAFESSVWAAGLVTPAIKRIAGRARPSQDEGARSFHPFDGHYESFPSGHSTNAWAIATAIATRYDDRPSVAVVAYALASSVSLARVTERHHFPSDVLAGALIGHAVARSIVHNHRTARIALVPTGRGVLVHATF